MPPLNMLLHMLLSQLIPRHQVGSAVDVPAQSGGGSVSGGQKAPVQNELTDVR